VSFGGLTFFTEHNVFKFHPCGSKHNIPFCDQIILHCMDIPHLVYPSVDGHLCCHILPTESNFAVTIPVHSCEHVFFFLGYKPRGQLLGHMVTLCSTF
jgi:hypothetical protein